MATPHDDIAQGQALLHLTDVGMRYRARSGHVTALQGVDLEIAAGEFIALVGPSGCGKTTLLKIMAGLVQGFSGSVALAGRPVLRPSAQVGVVFQEPTLLPWRTVEQNILLPAELSGDDLAAHTERARALMKTVGLSGFENRYPQELSGGMRQRAGICRALLRDPRLLLMDEPFGALDAMTREFMNIELQRIWMGDSSAMRKTVVFVTHSIPEAVFLADRVVILSPRPARLAEVVTVDLPRPRRLADMATPQAADVLARVRSHFSHEGGLE